MRRLRSATIVICSLLGLLVAAAGAATPVTRHTVPGVGFTIALPSTWQAIDYRKVAKGEVFDRLVKESPNLAPLVRAIRDPNSGVRFFAADPNTTNGFATNVNLVVEKVPSGTTVATYASAAAGQLAALPNVSRPIARTTVRLPAGPSVRLRYKVRLRLGAGQTLSVAITQYALVRRTDAFVVTYTTLSSLAAKRAATFETSARSIRLAR